MQKIIIAFLLLFVVACNIPSKVVYAQTTPKPLLTHRQEVWLGALEWCESMGVKTAVNSVDLDGTPSYYSFQFKPSTFALYAHKYGIKGDITDYEAQKMVVSYMILDYDHINWRNQFPDCIRNKIGMPPRP